MSENKRGLLYGLLCYCIWGLFPLYWRLLEHVDSLEILAHRMLWSGIFMMVFFLGIKKMHLRSHLKGWHHYLLLLLTGLLMTFNWGLYIWAINHGYILESSLGYYINPLLNVLLGCLFLRERLSRAQLIALLLAAVGVIYFTVDYGRFPFISICLAASFAIYGLCKKKIGLSASASLTVETMWMMPLALLYLSFLISHNASAFNHFNISTWLLLMLAGVVTAVPLLLYNKAAERITLSALGFLQYVSPTGQFLIGVLVYHEPFTTAHLICFGCIWSGLIIFSCDLLRNLKKEKLPHTK